MDCRYFDELDPNAEVDRQRMQRCIEHWELQLGATTASLRLEETARARRLAPAGTIATHTFQPPTGDAVPKGETSLRQVIWDAAEDVVAEWKARHLPFLEPHAASASAVVDAYVPEVVRLITVPCVATVRAQLEVQGRSAEGALCRHYAEILASSKGRAAMHRDYPVLARLLRALELKAVAAATELVHRHRADALPLSRLLGVATLGNIERATLKGDRHPGGETLLIEHASGHLVLYKPRPPSAEAVLEELVKLWNQHEADLPLRVPRSVPQETYAWSEYVPAQPPRDGDAALRCATRMGALVALCYGLCGTDLHRENFVVSGEMPVPVDAETLFFRRLSPTDTPVGRFLDGYLSSWLFSTQMLPFHSGDPRAAIHPTQFDLVLQRGDTSPAVYLHALAGGFGRGYQFLRRHRRDIMALVAERSDLVVRCVARSTSYYTKVLKRSISLEALTDGTARERALDPIWHGASLHRRRDRMRLAERAALLAGDVPRFFARFDSRDVCTDTGESLGALLDEDGRVVLEGRLDRLSDADQAQRLAELRLGWELLQ